MAITKELLEARLNEINKALESMTADVNAAIGRREEIKHCIAQIFEAEIKARAEGEENASS